MSGQVQRTIARATRLLIVAAGLLLAWQAYRSLLSAMPPLDADEAGRALPGARMALALRSGDLRGFFGATRHELVWPFLHPWLLAACFLVFGISDRVARACSLALLVAALGLLPPLARSLWPVPYDSPEAHVPARDVLGWLSVAAMLAAVPWHLACSVMSESLGMLLTVATLLCDAKAQRGSRLAWHAGTGLLAAAAFFTKYSYGLPLFAAVLGVRLWRSPRQGRGPFVAALAGVSLPVAAWLLAVLAPDLARGPELLGALVNRDEGLRGLTNLLFYPRALVEQLGWVAALATVALFVAALVQARQAPRLTALALVLVTVAALTLHPNKQDRYLFAVVPMALLLAEGELARRLAWRPTLAGLWLALALVLLAARDPLGRLRDEVDRQAALGDARAILAHAADQVQDRQPVLFLGTTGLLPHFALTWQILERQGREPDVALLTFPGEQGWDPRYRSGYPAQWGPAYGRALRSVLAGGRFHSVVTLALGERSPFRPVWLAKWDAFGQNYVRAMSEDHPAYVLHSQRDFPGAGAVVRVYVPDPSPPVQ